MIRDFFKEIKYFIQRGRRGWSDRDIWSFDSYLCEVIPPVMRKFSKNNVGCPGELYDSKLVNNECAKWQSILEEIAQGFEAAEEMKNLRFDFQWEKKGEKYTKEYKEEKQKQLAKKFDRGMGLFAKYFLNLWD